ncbi:MAG: flavodoxin family protein [Clostridiales bacterium]|nr:flavodoxin family protein [Clostridiales bacterium]
MRLIISDVLNLPSKTGDKLIIPDSTLKIHHCIGCFGCWIKTPGQCIIKDNYMNMGELLGHCNELILVSECVYGGFSPFVKNVLDRSISYISPYFTTRNKEMHHKQRYDNIINISAHFYGINITEKEKATVLNIIAANAVNFSAVVNGIVFHNSVDEIKGALA